MHKLMALAVASLLAATGATYAATAATDTAAVQAAPAGIYVGLNSGWAVIQTPETFPFLFTGRGRGDVGFGANVGYDWALSQHVSVGVEGGYQNFGSSDYSLSFDPLVIYSFGELNVASSGWDALLTAGYYWNNGFEVFAKAGAIVMTQKVTSSGGFADTFVSNGSNTKTRPMGVLGAGYNFKLSNGSVLEVTASFLHVTGKSYSSFTEGNAYSSASNLPIAAVNESMMGVSYHFAM
jgi:hypothetical protein